MTHNIYIYIILAGAVSYLLRMIPVTLLKKPIKNVYIRSFLYYVPYVTLAVMTFPAILTATGSVTAGLLALIAGLVASWFGASRIPAAGCGGMLYCGFCGRIPSAVVTRAIFW